MELLISLYNKNGIIKLILFLAVFTKMIMMNSIAKLIMISEFWRVTDNQISCSTNMTDNWRGIFVLCRGYYPNYKSESL